MKGTALHNLIKNYEGSMFAAEDYIWTHPETGYKEWNTSAYLEKVFEDLGYSLIKAGNIPGFYTDIDTGRPGPKVAILCELDALASPNHFQAVNGCAHACGHHAQCAAMVGIASALKNPEVLKELSGSVRLMAVPAEELIEVEFRDSLRKQGIIHSMGGKVEFLYRGYFDGVDIAYMFHTTSGKEDKFNCHTGSNGCIAKDMRYIGVAAHAGGSPDKGINSLYAASLGLQAINSLRETFKDEDHIRVHPIMTEGGKAVNIIPSSAYLSTYVRGKTLEAIAGANKKVTRAVAASALALGANVFISDRPGYAPLINCPAFGALAVEVMGEIVGKENSRALNQWGTGSTDMGDISTVIPVIHPHIAGAEGKGHGDEYHIADHELAITASAEGQVALLTALLENNAEKAKEIIASFKPIFASKEEYFETMDKFFRDDEMIDYFEDRATVKL